MSSICLTRKHSNLFIPITGLQVIQCANTEIVLAGCGGVVEARNLETGLKLCDSGILLTQAIRSIVPLRIDHHDNDSYKYGLLVQGGSQIAWVALCIQVLGTTITSAHFETVHKTTLKYWMICGRPSNSPEVAATFLTSHNALFHVKVNLTKQKVEFSQLNDELTTFLYSGDFIELDKSRYLVGSGTAFGQILVWSCELDESQMRWISRPWREFRGHQGSIFGVSISDQFHIGGRNRRIMASCSDDRTIRVWDLSDIHAEGQKDSGSITPRGKNKTDTFETSESTLAEVWAHVSRIWNVDIIASVSPMDTHPLACVISTGEDATAQSWRLHLEHLWPEAEIKGQIILNQFMDNNHAGKNIWSRCYRKENTRITFYTGAADGGIVVRLYDCAGRADLLKVKSSQAFKDIAVSSEDQQLLVTQKRKATMLRSYVILEPDEILATTESGLLIRGCAHHGRFTWQLVHRNDISIPFVLCLKKIADSIFLVDNSKHSLLIYDSRTLKLNSICSVQASKVAAVSVAWFDCDGSGVLSVCLSVYSFGTVELELVWVQMQDYECMSTLKSTISLPPKFEVTSTCYDPETRTLLAGSREGLILVYRSVTSETVFLPPTCLERLVHGADTITSIQKLVGTAADFDSDDFYLTTGRDGSYCVIQITSKSSDPVRIVHQAIPPIGPNIEGAHFAATPGGDKRLLLYGFRSTDFVVWDETHQRQVLAVNCGGAHRNWDFMLDDTTCEGGTFVWTKAGTLMHHRQSDTDYTTIRKGGHGREIKALAVTYTTEQRVLIATGSEDTNICIFEMNLETSTERRANCLTVLRKHTTGLQDLKFSKDGDYLFSAAGLEELYAWKLTPVPMIKQGVCFAGALPRQDVQSDARIMSIDTRSVVSSGLGRKHLLIAAFSNGRLKMIEYTAQSISDNLGTFTVLDQIDFGTICLTQTQILDFADGKQSTALVAATNGFVNVCTVNDTKSDDQPHMPVHVAHKIHQNSVTALQAVHITSLLQLILTGGDDNALGISLRWSHSNSKSVNGIKTILVPKAHTAALTALGVMVLEQNIDSFCRVLVVTAGNDQRIKAWILKINTKSCENGLHGQSRGTDKMEFIEIELLEDTHTNVADISELQILQSESPSGVKRIEHALARVCSSQGRVEVLVVGVGMEIVSLNISS